MSRNEFLDAASTASSWRRWAVALAAAGCLIGAAGAHAQDVRSVACVPTVIAGGSGASTTCTVTLTAPAATGGTAVALTSSLPALAASARKVTVPAGQSTATFKVGTNAKYRRYSALAFNASISATVA